jgi:putative transposase
MKSAYVARGYRTNETTVYCCRYHIIFCPKYRRKVLTEQIAKRFKEIVVSLKDDMGFCIIEMEVMPDHVHLLLDIDPNVGVLAVVKRIKGQSAIILRREFPELKKKIPCLWTRSKFIATVGAVSLEVVKKYIEEQKGK